jgi:heme/copper-type cytochrome/quinol oxidase subunit 1
MKTIFLFIFNLFKDVLYSIYSNKKSISLLYVTSSMCLTPVILLGYIGVYCTLTNKPFNPEMEIYVILSSVGVTCLGAKIVNNKINLGINPNKKEKQDKQEDINNA